MKIKNVLKSLIAILSIAFVFSGCQNNDKEYDLPSHSVVEVSHQYQNFTVQINQEVSVADLSSGVVDRTWSLDEGVEAIVYKLDKDVPDILEIRDLLRDRNNLSDEELAIVLEKIQLGDQTVLPTYKDAVLKLSFPTGGVYNVYLKHTFQENAYVEQEETKRDTTVVDRMVTINVFERVLFTDFTVSELDTNGNPGTPMPILVENNTITQRATVTAGKTARIGFNYSGSPDNVEVTSGNAKLVENSLVLNADGTGSIDVKYSRVGEYDLVVNGVRATPAANYTITLENAVEVIPSTDPVTIDRSVVNSDLGITLAFSREMDEATLLPTDFAVNITDKNGNNVPVTVDTAVLDPQDAAILYLTLAGDSAYDDDTVTVSYTKGTFSTTDGVLLENQTDLAVLTGQNPNIIGDAGMFENPLAVDWNWVGNKTITSVEIVDPPTPVHTTSVSPSGKVVWLTVNKSGPGAANGANCETARAIDGIEIGKSYRFLFKRYVRNDPSVTGSKAANLIFRFISPTTTSGNGDQFFPLNIGDPNSIDRWVDSELIFTVDKDAYIGAKMRMVTQWSTYADIHIDDLVFQEYNLRP